MYSLFSRHLIAVSVAAALLCSCAGKENAQLSKTGRLVMGTFVEVTVVGPADKVKPTIQAVFDEMTRVEDLTSFHKPSPATQLNQKSGSGPVKTDPDLVALVDRSLHVARETNGAFDPTVGALTLLWRFSGGDARVPGESEISQALTKVGWNRVTADLREATIDLPERGMALDLGAIAKGYALERGADVIRRSGAPGGLINAGGDVIAVGEKEPGKPWRVGVRDPRNPRELVAVVEARDRAIMTSGDYERFFIDKGKRYHHILDPRTGYPVEGLQSVTLVAPDAMTVLSCAVFALGAENGLNYAASKPNVEALLVDSHGEIHTTPGARAWFKDLK
jgi:thiamine biosynthesis lipoprotein